MPPLPEGADGRGRPQGDHRRDLPLRRRPRRPSPKARATCGRRSASRGRCGASPRGAADPGRALRRRRRHLGRHVVDEPAHRRARGGALEPAAPRGEPRAATITTALGGGPDPVVAITDYMRGVPDQVARFVDRPYMSLGTDGFGRSDARDALRSYFEVDAAHLVVAVLQQLALGGQIEPSVVSRGHRRVRHRRRRRTPRFDRCRPESSAVEQRHERGQRLLGAVGHGQDERAPVRLQREAERRRRGSTPSPAGPAPRPPSGRPPSRAGRDAPTGRVDLHRVDRRRARTRAIRRPAPPSPPRPGCRRSADLGAARSAGRRLERHRRCAATSASRVSSIWPRCWNSSSRMCSSTAPLVSV